MDNFWAKLVIGAVVAALGLLFISKVYIPQKEAHTVMAETSTQTLNAVKSEIDETADSSSTKSSLLTSIDLYYADSTVVIAIGSSANRTAYVDVTGGVATILGSSSGAEYTFTGTSTKDDLKALATTDNYRKTVYKSSSGAIVLIKYDPVV